MNRNLTVAFRAYQAASLGALGSLLARAALYRGSFLAAALLPAVLVALYEAIRPVARLIVRPEEGPPQ